MSARELWLSEYRANRAADALWRYMRWLGHDAGVPSFVVSVPGWGQYDSTRLWPDLLGVFPLAGPVSAHRCRMLELSKRVRLPA